MSNYTLNTESRLAISFVIAILLAAGLNSTRAQNTWTQKANFGGTARKFAVGFSIGSKGYIGTGFMYDGSSHYYKDLWEYNPSTNVWTQKADFGGAARIWAVGFSISSKGYIGTGQDLNLNNKKDFWEYDPVANTWTQKANLGGAARLSAVGFSIGNKGYIATGNKSFCCVKDFWEYDPSTDTWTQKTDIGGAGRVDAIGFSIGNKGYLGLGNNLSADNLHDFWEYDPSSDAWSQKANFGGTAGEGAVGFSIGSTGYVGTGEYFDAQSNVHYSKEFWTYNPVANTWTQKADFGGTAGSYATGFSIGNKGYIGIGYDGSYRNDFWEYAPDHAITTGTITGSPFCPEATVNVPFTSIGVFNAGNVYTAELSDNTGSFLFSSTAIGILNSTANSGTIAATIPSKPKASSKYRIRVTSSNPIVWGTDNEANLKLIACKKVTALSASGLTATSATLNWTGVSCKSKYKVQYRKQGTTSWTTQFSTTNSSIITGLTANTTYEYQVETYCSASGSSNSAFTSIKTFTTTLRLASGSASEEATMSIYPNPAKDQATIQFTLAQSSHVSIKVYEISGKEIETLMNDEVEEGIHTLLLNTKDFIKGVYLVKMISDFGIENQKLIVQ